MQLMQLGFDPAHLVGVDMMPERIAAARRLLPEAIRLVEGDACVVETPGGPFDLIMQSTVFSSILDHGVQAALAARMWSLLKPGGAILWYDFVFNNPRNPDVAGVPSRRVRALFPEGRFTTRRLTLAPPLARALVRVHPFLYSVFNFVPWLRTHRMCWIEKI
jgi:ubiquinone/menaquinone biosynthesis C-methylase UbiE